MSERILQISTKRQQDDTLSTLDIARKQYEDGLTTYTEFIVTSHAILAKAMDDERKVLRKHLSLLEAI